MLRCRSISSPSIGSGTSVPPAVSTERAERLVPKPGAPADPVGLVRVELVGLGGHLLVQLVAEPRPCGSNAGRCGARQRHEERLLPVVRHEPVAGVQVAELLVGVDLLLRLVGADVAEGERGGLQHASTRPSPGRPARM